MPKYQVTLTYLITVDASDEDGAELMAVSEVSSDPTCFNDCEIERVDTWVDTYDPSADIASILEMLDEYDKENYEKLKKKALSILSEMEMEK